MHWPKLCIRCNVLVCLSSSAKEARGLPKTDARINQLTYGLYGLAEDEIEMAVGAMPPT
jgi:hypothetical protein